MSTDKLEPKLLEAHENPYNIPVIDLRGPIGNLTSYTTNKEYVANAVSYGCEDGLIFKKQKPHKSGKIKTSLFYPTDGYLVDGVLFNPREMEDK